MRVGEMTAQEVFDLTTKGGATDFGSAVSICRGLGPFCLIGGLAVNCYVEPVFTLDADFVVVSSQLDSLSAALSAKSFSLERFGHSLNARAPESDLRLQFTTDPRYQGFPTRA